VYCSVIGYDSMVNFYKRLTLRHFILRLNSSFKRSFKPNLCLKCNKCKKLSSMFQSTALAKVTSPAWCGFTNAADRNRLEAFIRRAVRHGYCALHLLSPRSVIKPIRHCLIA